MINPFEEVTPAEPIDPWQALTTSLFRSILWDMVGPNQITNNPEKFNQHPASQDVLEAETEEMWARKRSLMPLGMDFPLLCRIAADSASLILMRTDEEIANLDEEAMVKFRIGNIRLGTAVAESVVSHMLQRGLIKYGDPNEFLGQ